MQFDLSKVTDLKQREEAARLYEVYCKADEAVEQAGPGANLDALQEARDNAWDAYAAVGDDYLQINNDTGQVIRCAISGVPLWESDDIALVLRSAIGLPPTEQPLHPAYAEAE